MWLPSQFYIESEVVWMIEEILLQLFILSFFINVFFAFLIITLLVVITINMCKKDHISKTAN